jgi:hypothetical protein
VPSNTYLCIVMEISENSRVWIYQANRTFNSEEEKHILQKLAGFTSQWQAHGHQLTALAEIRYHRFIVLMVDESKVGASGCSIDTSVHLLKEIERQFNVSLFDRFNIAYRPAPGEIDSCSRNEFEKLLVSGLITENTIVFNNLIQTVKELNSKWEVPLKDSWHADVFSDLIS